jgi:hypothetical protein
MVVNQKITSLIVARPSLQTLSLDSPCRECEIAKDRTLFKFKVPVIDESESMVPVKTAAPERPMLSCRRPGKENVDFIAIPREIYRL